jgi:hypothetical protein
VNDDEPVTGDNTARPSVVEPDHPADGYVGDPAVQAEWDRRYAEQNRPGRRR